MTASKFKNRCPVCQSKSWRLRSHLDDVHSVRNAQERRILLAFARGRVSVRGMKCPISGCTYGGSRVAQHLLDAHRDLGAKEKRRHLRKLQWRKTLRQVRELRASGPDPPLATRLDLDGSEGSEAAAAAATGSPPPPPASSPPSQAEPCPSPPHSTSADSPQRPETSLPGGLGTSADVPAAGPVVELEMTGVPQTRAEPQAPSSSTMSRKISELDPQTLAELLAKEARRGSETPALRIRCALPYFSLRPSSRRDDQPYHRRGPGGREGHQLFLSGGRTQCLSHPRGTGLDPAVDGDQGSATPAVRSGIFQYQPPAREKHHPVREERVGSHATARQTLPYRHPDRRRDDVQEHPLQ
ncbi:protein transport protein sec31 isoform X2 [Xiphophorus couchianus]|uniref:protein transport protein sec31 isoform X2 n=1 Tax=Xiphophorus couchianus TaxID=32473 RepID=UPI0010163CF3|nr:protein transport protein sec31 isoform X2 [Xiphophorus couchianus]